MISLDGYFEGSNHDLDWHNTDVEFNEFAIDQLNDIDTLLFGRRTYDLMASVWPTEEMKKNDPVIAEKMNTIPKIVFSRTLEKADWENTTLCNNDLIETIQKLKAESGRDIAIFGSSNLCTSLIEHGLIDEFRFMVNPVVLGGGTPLFKNIKEPLSLQLIAERKFTNGNVLLVYTKKTIMKS